MRVAFLGLGSMGLPMARNLARSDHDLVVWNRTRAKAEDVAGAQVADSPEAAAEGADLVLTMLSGDDAVEAVMFGDEGAAASMREGAVHASMSTISVEYSRHLAQAHGEREQRYVAAPVFGRPDMAASAALRIVAAGRPAAIDACRPAFDVLGQAVIEVGSEPEKANVVKLTGNFMLASAIEAMAEAYTLVRSYGVDVELFHQTMAQGLFASPIYQGYGGMIARQEYEPAGFALRHGLKDVRFALRAADDNQVPMPFASAVHDRLLSGAARGWSDSDWAALGRVAAADSGQEG